MNTAHALFCQQAGATMPERIASALAGDLLTAIERDEIEVLFQPQFDCADGQIAGAEALARWRHPTLGMIGADQLFAIAGRNDQVSDLSCHVVAQALNMARSWPTNLRLSLNITPQELAKPHFARDFAQMVTQSGIAPQRLTLEITEDLLVQDIATAGQALAALREKGLRVALDDFGAGFCNFAYLKHLPIDAIKLDRSMVTGVCSDPRDRAVLRAIVALADALDLDVVAEGIETEAQRDVVIAEGCTYWQGFLQAQPMSSDAMIKLAVG
ncbi:EAL domain-containing protein [Erythrobacteraceae bacterium E2-1 Yellow Sea]|nr:EAL domain-containing protein [Erythrobacteraceae bacterium E2-1 Yellow Sea]